MYGCIDRMYLNLRNVVWHKTVVTKDNQCIFEFNIRGKPNNILEIAVLVVSMMPTISVYNRIYYDGAPLIFDRGFERRRYDCIFFSLSSLRVRFLDIISEFPHDWIVLIKEIC